MSSLSERVPERIGFFNDGPCQWCKKAEGALIVNLPGNALKTRVCGPCLKSARDHGGNWQEICYTCMGTGDLGDDFSPCETCEGTGYDMDSSEGWDDDDFGWREDDAENVTGDQ